MGGERFELSIERRIDASVAHVWQVMTERLPEWFCPRPWRAEARVLEWHAGGRSLIVMHGPNGEEMPNEGMVLAYEPQRRFVMTDAFVGDWQPSGPFMVGLFEVEADGDATLYRGTARHWTKEAMEQHRAMGFEQGWGAAAEQLKALAEAAAMPA